MTEKFNESTYNRPEGSRPIDAPRIIHDLQQVMDQLRSENAWLRNDRNAITLFKGAGIRIVMVAMHGNTEIMTEANGSFLSLQVLLGSVQAYTPQGSFPVAAGQIVTLHDEPLERITAGVESVFLLTMTQDA